MSALTYTYPVGATLGAAFILFLFGSIPFGLLWTRLLTGKDIRRFGSGNVGATNALRSGNKIAALLTLVGDILKGYLGLVLLSGTISQTADPYLSNFARVVCILAPVLGHIYSPWLKFNGGKGVATGLGVLGFVDPWLAALGVGAWAIIFLVTRIASLSSIGAVSVASIGGCLMDQSTTLFPQPLYTYIFYCSLAAIIILKHKSNIMRLINGEEAKFEQRAPKK